VDATWDIQRVGEFPLARPLSLVIDGRGNAHFVTYDRQGITYWTNANGEWQNERIGSGADGSELDTDPVIGINEAGDVVVAYSRSSCSGFGCIGAQILVTMKTSSGWSRPDRIAAGLSPQMAVLDGAIGLTYTAIEEVGDEVCGEPSPVDVALATGRGWQIERVSDDAYRPWLAMDVGGAPHVLIDNLCGTLGDAGVYLAEPTDPAGTFTTDAIPETESESGDNSGYAIVVDAIGRTHAIYSRYVDGVGEQYVYVVQKDGSWSSPFESIPGRSARWMATDQASHVHILGHDDGGVWHATDTTGAWTLDQVSDKSGTQAALALDAAGEPHVLFGTGGDLGGRTTLWYAVITAP
jgi:hypothetical protein